MNYQATKQDYETANEWHMQKSMGYMWSREIEKFLKLSSAASPKVLDVGCGGSGRDIAQFLEKGALVEGLDYSHAAIETVRTKFPALSFYEADMMNTGLASGSYDGVWACASLLNLTKEDAPKALAEFNRLLKPNGALFVSVKKGEGEKMIPDQGGERFFSFYTEAELSELVAQAGFTVSNIDVQQGTVHSQPGVLEWISLYAKKI